MGRVMASAGRSTFRRPSLMGGAKVPTRVIAFFNCFFASYDALSFCKERGRDQTQSQGVRWASEYYWSSRISVRNCTRAPVNLIRVTQRPASRRGWREPSSTHPGTVFFPCGGPSRSTAQLGRGVYSRRYRTRTRMQQQPKFTTRSKYHKLTLNFSPLGVPPGVIAFGPVDDDRAGDIIDVCGRRLGVQDSAQVTRTPSRNDIADQTRALISKSHAIIESAPSLSRIGGSGTTDIP